MQGKRIADTVDPFLPITRPANDRVEDRTDVAPDRWIPRPQKIAPGGPPTSRLGAEKRDRRARVSIGECDLGHGVTPSNAAAAISASVMPEAQTISGLPLARPSPLRKSLT